MLQPLQQPGIDPYASNNQEPNQVYDNSHLNIGTHSPGEPNNELDDIFTELIGSGDRQQAKAQLIAWKERECAKAYENGRKSVVTLEELENNREAN